MSGGSDVMPGVDGQRPVPENGAMEESSTAETRDRAKERRLAERGDRILDALATLIARWGYGKTTVDDVAREAGVAKGTVYLHWPTKGAMLHALIEREEQQWNAIIAERMASDPRGGTLSSLYGHAMALCLENPLLRALFIQDHDALGEWTRSPQSRERADQRMERLYTLLEALRTAGTLRTDPAVGVQAYLLIALSYGILTVDEFLPAKYVPPIEDVVNAYAEVVHRAFEPDLPDGAEAPALARGQEAIASMISSLEKNDKENIT